MFQHHDHILLSYVLTLCLSILLFVSVCVVVCLSPSLLQMSHNAVGAFCRSVKLQCELYPSREVAICLDPYCGLGFVLWCLCRLVQTLRMSPAHLLTLFNVCFNDGLQQEWSKLKQEGRVAQSAHLFP